jgi:signal transduction histidine kinase
LSAVNGLAIDAQDRVWLALDNDSLGIIEQGRLRTLGVKDGVEYGSGLAIHLRDRQVWASGDRGLAVWMDGRLSTLRGADGQAFIGCSGLLQTAAGDLWLNCVGGLHRIRRSEWLKASRDASYRVTSLRFDHSDGVLEEPIQGAPLPSLAEGSDGLIWFATRESLYWLDPKSLTAARPAPTVVIQKVVADEVRYAADADISLPAGTQRVQFSFLAPGAEAPQRTKFRYRLRGLDTGWVDAGTRREVGYNSLRPGVHELEVVASDREGSWGSTPTTVRFRILPEFHQTIYFYALCVLAGLLLAGTGYRLRVRQITERTRLRTEAQVQERVRIARDLHDTVLQSTQGLVLAVQSIADRMPADHPSRASLDRALERADEAIREGRLKVLELRDVDDGQLEDWLRDAAGAVEAEGSAQLVVVREGEPRALGAAVRRHVLRIGQEAVSNAQRHAQAKFIELRLVYGEAAFELTISDDGHGMPDVLMDGSVSVRGHWGLQGMRERAAELGAEFSIRAREGGGTVVRFSVPAALAYSSS